MNDEERLRDAPGLGHNQPPPPAASLDLTPEQWADRLITVFGDARQRSIELQGSFQRFELGFRLLPPLPGGAPIGIERWSDEVQGRAGDLRDKIIALLKTAEAMHTVEKAPVLVAQRAVDGFLRSFREPLDNALRTIRGRQTTYANWQDAQSRKLAAEQAALRQAEADAAAKLAMRTLDTDDLQEAAEKAGVAEEASQYATAKPAEHTRTHGEAGSVTSLRATWTFIPEESDVMELAKAVVAGTVPASYLTFNETRIRLAIRVEHVHAIPGCVIREEKTAR